MLPGWCCIANRHIGARERKQLMPHVRFSGSISGAGKSIEIRLRMCGPPLFQLYKRVAKINAVVIFCLLHRPAFAVDFAILRSHFWYRQTVPKMGL